MSKILISGLITIETTVKVEGFPIPYQPVHYPFFGVGTTVSGPGYNIAKALGGLGHEVSFISIVGKDLSGDMVRQALSQDGVPVEGVRSLIDQTSQSVIVYDQSGKRMIYCDLKDLQETAYPAELARQALEGSSLAVLNTINFSRPLLAEAKRRGIPIVTDLHVLNDLDDAFNKDFMEAADIVFMSHDGLREPPRDFLRRYVERYRPRVMVMGMGGSGALLWESGEDRIEHLPAHTHRPIVSTIGAGDSLCAAFIDAWVRGLGARDSLERAMHFAAWKIGVASASAGFLDGASLDRLWRTGELPA